MTPQFFVDPQGHLSILPDVSWSEPLVRPVATTGDGHAAQARTVSSHRSAPHAFGSHGSPSVTGWTIRVMTVIMLHTSLAASG